VAHHTYCGATPFTRQSLIKAFHAEQGMNVSTLYDHTTSQRPTIESWAEHDARLLRESKGTPKNVNIYGYMFNIDTEALILLAEARGVERQDSRAVDRYISFRESINLRLLKEMSKLAPRNSMPGSPWRISLAGTAALSRESTGN
jgi:hypothetical protein